MNCTAHVPALALPCRVPLAVCLPVLAAIVCLVLSTATVAAAPPSEADLLAPYLDEQTLLIAGFEVARPSVDDALEKLTALFTRAGRDAVDFPEEHQEARH